MSATQTNFLSKGNRWEYSTNFSLREAMLCIQGQPDKKDWYECIIQTSSQPVDKLKQQGGKDAGSWLCVRVLRVGNRARQRDVGSYLTIKSTGSCSGPGFSSQLPHGRQHIIICNFSSGDLMPSSGLLRYYMHVVYIHTRKHSYVHAYVIHSFMHTYI